MRTEGRRKEDGVPAEAGSGWGDWWGVQRGGGPFWKGGRVWPGPHAPLSSRQLSRGCTCVWCTGAHRLANSHRELQGGAAGTHAYHPALVTVAAPAQRGHGKQGPRDRPRLRLAHPLLLIQANRTPHLDTDHKGLPDSWPELNTVFFWGGG